MFLQVLVFSDQCLAAFVQQEIWTSPLLQSISLFNYRTMRAETKDLAEHMVLPDTVI